MPKICYEPKKFNADHASVIETANTIIAEYEAQGFALTLRQLYYQFVARALIENTERSYKRLGLILNQARMAGLIDWDAIEDRTRWLRAQAHWSSQAHIVEACAEQFRVDMWADQKVRPEVWIEKDALVGVIEAVCNELDVPFFACRGYVSQSEQWRAGRRHREYARRGQRVVVFHFGDHDPSGIDMSRDNAERLKLFAGARHCELRRLALTREQVEQYGCPPNPAKLTDSRIGSYLAEHGDESWELDALEPQAIVDLVRSNVETLIDASAWAMAKEREREGRETLAGVVRQLRGEDEDYDLDD